MSIDRWFEQLSRERNLNMHCRNRLSSLSFSGETSTSVDRVVTTVYPVTLLRNTDTSLVSPYRNIGRVAAVRLVWY